MKQTDSFCGVEGEAEGTGRLLASSSSHHCYLPEVGGQENICVSVYCKQDKQFCHLAQWQHQINKYRLYPMTNH